jgi:predicted DNA-binding transcriptional regulator YafY
VLADSKFDPAKETRRYPGDPEQQEARQNLHKIVAEAREALNDPVARSMALIEPEKMRPVPGAKVDKIGGEAPAEVPVVTIAEARVLIEKAMSKERDLEMVYLTSSGQRMECLVQPQRMAFKADTPVLVGLDINENERRSFLLDRIERMRIEDED